MNLICLINSNFFLFIDHPTERTNDKLILAKNENQRLQNELENIERKFQRLDSRKFCFFS
jgi:hypothetical protein